MISDYYHIWTCGHRVCVVEEPGCYVEFERRLFMRGLESGFLEPDADSGGEGGYSLIPVLSQCYHSAITAAMGLGLPQTELMNAAL